MSRLQELGFQTYEQYLRSKHWRRMRWHFLKQEHRCLVCGNRAFELHHVSYARLGREKMRDLRPLCDQHHEQVHTMIGMDIGQTDWAINQLIPEVLKQGKKGHLRHYDPFPGLGRPANKPSIARSAVGHTPSTRRS